MFMCLTRSVTYEEIRKPVRRITVRTPPHPRHSNVEGIPIGIYAIYLIYMPKQFSSESNRQRLVIKQGPPFQGITPMHSP